MAQHALAADGAWAGSPTHCKPESVRNPPGDRMTLAVVMSRSIDGLNAPEVHVEVHLANGLPAFTLVGLAETEVKEARERDRKSVV